jgi:photosystem II stability/assembly factor-like uncharacterized protein
MTTLVLVGTRKGLFVLESDADRRDWKMRGPYCEGWPIYHAIHDPESRSIYAAAASEWHGSVVWRSPDLGETWEHSSEGLSYEGTDLKLSKVSNVAAAHGRLWVGGEGAGLFLSQDEGKTFSLVSTLEGQPGRDDWNDPAQQPPGHLGLSAIIPSPDDPEQMFAIVQGYSLFETTDGGKNWSPRNKGLRSPVPIEEDAEIGFCCHKVVVASDDRSRMFQQNHAGMYRSDDAAKTWTEISEGLPTDFGFAAAVHPHDRDTFYVIPLDPGHGRTMPDGQAAVWRTRDAGSSWTKLTSGLPQIDAYLGVLREGMANDHLDAPGFYFGTSTGQVFASVDDGDSWSEIASYLPSISSVEVAVV